MHDPAHLWPDHESRAVTFENPTGARGAGGTAAGGRKGAPNRVIAPGETIDLVDIAGPGRIGHVWMTVGSLPDISVAPPAFLRAQVLEVFYDDQREPSVSVPVPDLFGAVHGVGASYTSSLTTVNERRAYASRVPMPFGDRVRIRYTNAADRPALLYFQVDLLLGPEPPDTGRLHVVFRRENPTALGEDFEIVPDSLRGPGRILGWNGGIRPVADPWWWGEGEVKVYFDGEAQPTICGTGSEDNWDSAWCLGTYAAPEAGAPLCVAPGGDDRNGVSLASWYRWHLSDPLVFTHSARMTIQQIGSVFLRADDPEADDVRDRLQTAGHGWLDLGAGGAFTLYERADDWCSTAFVYCAEPQPVARYDVAAGTADLTGVPDGHEPVLRS